MTSSFRCKWYQITWWWYLAKSAQIFIWCYWIVSSCDIEMIPKHLFRTTASNDYSLSTIWWSIQSICPCQFLCQVSVLSWKLAVPVDSHEHKGPAAANGASTTPYHRSQTGYPPTLGGSKTIIRDVAMKAQSRQTSLRRFATCQWSEGPRSSD